MQHQPAPHRADQHQLLLPARLVPPDGHAPHREHRLAQQPVRLLAALVRPEELRLLEVDRVHLLDRDELLDLDRLVALGLERLQLVLAQHHVLVARVLVAAHGLVPLHHFTAGRAHVLLLEARAVLGVEHVEVDALRTRRRVHLHGDRHEAEGDRPGGSRASRQWRTSTGGGRGSSRLRIGEGSAYHTASGCEICAATARSAIPSERPNRSVGSRSRARCLRMRRAASSCSSTRRGLFTTTCVSRSMACS